MVEEEEVEDGNDDDHEIATVEFTNHLNQGNSKNIMMIMRRRRRGM